MAIKSNKKWSVQMYQVREVLRLYFESERTKNQISISLNLSFSTVSIIINRAKEKNLDYKTAKEMSDSRLNELIYPNKPGKKSDIEKVRPNYEYIVSELKKKKMTKTLLYKEYSDEYKDRALSFSSFCFYLRSYIKQNSLSMVLIHKPGEKAYIDYCGMTVPIYDKECDNVEFNSQIFVATLPYSEYSYFEAHSSQSAKWFINGCVRAFNYFGGVTEILVTDNLKASVIANTRNDVKLSKAMIDFAQYYSIIIEPTRPYKPKDKARVESRVGYVERNVLNALRNTKFYSLNDLNIALLEYVKLTNSDNFTKKPFSRKDVFESEKSHLLSLPEVPYTYGEYYSATVPSDYHITYDNVKYSVPNEFRNKQVDYRVTDKAIEIYYESKLIATHNLKQIKTNLVSEPVTDMNHMPENHIRYLNLEDKELISKRAQEIGINTKKVIDAILNLPSITSSKTSANSLLMLANLYSKEELEKASTKAVHIDSMTKATVEAILKSKNYEIVEVDPTEPMPSVHDNIRGNSYYSNEEAF
jgi:transposase